MTDNTGDLFGYRPEKHETRADQIFRRFCEFHKANPHIWHHFRDITFELIHLGFDHYGAGAVYEQIRWRVNTTTRTFDGLKLSNDFRAYYARMFHAAYPEHDGFFRNRKRRSEDRPGFADDTTFVNIDPPSINEGRLLEQLLELLRQTNEEENNNT